MLTEEKDGGRGERWGGVANVGGRGGRKKCAFWGGPLEKDRRKRDMLGKKREVSR